MLADNPSSELEDSVGAKFYWQYALDAFTAFTPLVGHQEEHPVCKKFSDEVMAWLSV